MAQRKFTCIWKDFKPNEADLDVILADHKDWFETADNANLLERYEWLEKHPIPHNLSKAHINRTNFSRSENFGVKFILVDYFGVDLSGAKFMDIELSQANLMKADLSGADLSGANLHGADLSGADLSGADLRGAKLNKANLWKTQLIGADLSGADLSGANLSGADLSDCNVTGVRYHRPWLGIPFIQVRDPGSLTCRGIRVDSCYGSPRFRRDVMDQDYLEEMRSTPMGRIICWLWDFSSNCGRSFALWALLSALFALVFASVFWFLGPEAFKVPGGELYFSHWTMLYYSVVTFTTLGFGDITPLTRAASFWVMFEVVVGYIMLGGLISIFANKMARRSG